MLNIIYNTIKAKVHYVFIAIIFIVLGFFTQIIFVEAATFQIQTGTYVGDGTDDRTITGLGFQPEMVLLKDNTNVGNNGLIFKTSVMPGELSLVTAETDAPLATNHIQSLDSDGFTVGNDADTNSANIMYYYVAFEGSDCSATGTFCVSSYTGTGAIQGITTVGFKPDLVVTKRAGNSRAAWKTSAMTGTASNAFSSTNQYASNRINSLDATGFSVGTTNEVNRNANTYYYFAFKEVTGFMDVGTYTGNGVDNRVIDSVIDAGLTFQPDFTWTKAETNRNATASIREHYGDRSFLFTDGNSNRNRIQDLLPTGGFEVGSHNFVNQNAVPYNYVAFAGAPVRAAGVGTYNMAEGTYNGTGSAFSLTGLGFEPDLVIIKGENTQNAVFRTSLMSGDRTAYIGASLNVFTGGILSLDSDGFSVGTSVVTNTSTDIYYWTAFGNAFRMDRTGGASDFMVGQYIGTARDDTDVFDIPMSPDFISIKRAANTLGAWRTASQVGDQTLYFRNIPQSANRIQALNGDGFQLGANGRVNASGSIYDYFMFKEGPRFDVATYTGTGVVQDITTASFQPDFLWLKKTTGGTGRNAVLRNSQQAGDNAQSFLTAATLTGRITDLVLNGFSLGTGVESNENTFTYQYASWNNKKYTQQSYRFFENDDSTDVGAALAAVDTVATLVNTDDPFRLRMLVRVDGGNLFTSSEEFTLQFAEKVGTCDTSFTGEIYADVTAGTAIAFNDNGTPADNDTLTANASDPTDGARVIVNQQYKEDNDTTNGVSAINQEQTGKWDYSLIDNNAEAGTGYCFRLIYVDGDELLEMYTVIPEIQTTPLDPQLTFNISDDSIGFAQLNSLAPRYATGNELGSDVDVAAHTFSALTNATSGYTVTVLGKTLNAGLPAIDAIGSSALVSSPGIEQFGMRSVVVSGTGVVSAPFNTVNWAFDDTGVQELATGVGDETTTDYEMHYIANISSATDAGGYETNLTYIITAGF